MTPETSSALVAAGGGDATRVSDGGRDRCLVGVPGAESPERDAIDGRRGRVTDGRRCSGPVSGFGGASFGTGTSPDVPVAIAPPLAAASVGGSRRGLRGEARGEEDCPAGGGGASDPLRSAEAGGGAGFAGVVTAAVGGDGGKGDVSSGGGGGGRLSSSSESARIGCVSA